MESSLLFCEICENKICLKTKKPCQKIEKQLPKPQTGRLKGEFYLSNDLIDRNFAIELNGEVINLKTTVILR